VYDSQGRMLGDYGAGATAAGTRGEYIYINPDAANDNASPFGGDDGMGGYGLLAVATKDAANAPVIHYIHSNHLGVPILTLNSAGAVIAIYIRLPHAFSRRARACHRHRTQVHVQAELKSDSHAF
jgi:hypothetical protein